MKLKTLTNFRVEVTPREPYLGRDPKKAEAIWADLCKDIASQIKRHVDDVGSADVVFDTKESCSHCDYGWEVATDDSDPEFPKGCPLCCEAAIEEFKAGLAAQSQPATTEALS